VQTYDANYAFTVVRRAVISLFLFQMPNTKFITKNYKDAFKKFMPCIFNSLVLQWNP